MIFELHTCCPEHIFDTPLNGVASMFIIVDKNLDGFGTYN